MIQNPEGMRLGRKPARQDKRTLRLARYLTPAVFANIPPTRNWGTAVEAWDMLRNDELGDCTAASVGHIIHAHTANRGAPARLTDRQVTDLYIATSGYRPSDPSSDQGAVMLDVLNHWRKAGVAGHQIEAFVALDIDSPAMLKAAIWLFGAIYVGVDLPLSAQDQDPWFVANRELARGAQPGSWGGHCVPMIGYDTKTFNCITWGAPHWMTEDWWLAYGMEAYAVLSPDWAPPGQLAPNHFNIEKLRADLAAIT